MTDKPKRSYAKASYKTKPYTVRFDTEKFDFFMSREKLETAQQLVDHFLNSYWWQWKVAKPTHKDVPPERLNDMPNYKPATPAFYDGKKNSHVTHDESAIWQEEKPKIKRSYEYFEISIANGECEDPEFHKNLIKEINESELPQRDKDKLIQASKVKQY